MCSRECQMTGSRDAVLGLCLPLVFQWTLLPTLVVVLLVALMVLVTVMVLVTDD